MRALFDQNAPVQLHSDCKLLANSGVAKIMNMDTYFAPDFAGWYQQLLPTLAEGIPRDKVGAGLGIYNCTAPRSVDSRGIYSVISRSH